METLAAEFEIFQPQTAQELQPLEESAEMHTKQPEETIPQEEELFDWIIQNNVQQFTSLNKNVFVFN